MAGDRTLNLPVGHKSVRLAVTGDGGFELWLDGCLRKRCEPSSREPLYVWTNVELHWEEHRYVEARYWRSEDRVQATINGEPAVALPVTVA